MIIVLDSALIFLILVLLEIVLGIDNLIILAIISQRLPPSEQKRARRIGLTLAWILRLLLLAFAVWLTHLTIPLLTAFGFEFSGRDLFMLIGGFFLIAKATQEIHAELEPANAQQKKQNNRAQFFWVITQIAALDLLFSLDTVLTAIGLTQQFWIMASAITLAIFAMIFASEPLSYFIERHPTLKMLALSFILLIGVLLLAEGFEFHVPRAYVYVAMAFALLVEGLNMIRRAKRS